MEGQTGDGTWADGVLSRLSGRDYESVEQWLKRTRQTELSIRHFWNPILMATLNDRTAHCSTRYAGKVFHELFIKSSTGGRLGIPTVPLSEFYAAAARLIESRGGTVQLRASVEAITQEQDGRWRVSIADKNYMQIRSSLRCRLSRHRSCCRRSG